MKKTKIPCNEQDKLSSVWLCQIQILQVLVKSFLDQFTFYIVISSISYHLWAAFVPLLMQDTNCWFQILPPMILLAIAIKIRFFIISFVTSKFTNGK